MLWRKNDAGYLNKVKRAKAIEEIVTLMKCTEKYVFEAWKALRDNFKKEFKLLHPIKSETGRQKSKTWIYYKNMLFISSPATESGSIDSKKWINR